jgi:Concanavalin A-like lectin/glucanases superfamily
MRTVHTALAIVLLLPTLALAQLASVNLAHPLAQGLLQWHLVYPLLSGGPQWYNLMGVRHGTLTNMGSGSGWQPSLGGRGWGEMRFDGSDDGVSLGALALWQFSNTTFTAAFRFRFTGASTGYLLASRTVSPSTSGGYFLRLEGSSGTIMARIMTSGGTAVAERTTVRATYNDGQWHSVVAVFRTDTSTGGGNDVTIYGDGVLDQGSLTFTGGLGYDPCENVTPGCLLMLGTNHDGLAFMLGGMDDVRIWQRGLSAAEVLTYHTQMAPDYGGMLLAEPVALGIVAPATPRVKRRVTIQ